MPTVYLLREGDEDERALAAVLGKLSGFECRVRVVRGDAATVLADVPDEAVVLTYLRDQTMTEVVALAAGHRWKLALVPPLVVAGIGLGWFQWPVFFGASLLFLTNLAGILFAAAITF